MTPEELQSIKDGAARWHSISGETALKLVAEIERLQSVFTDTQRIALIQRLYNAGHF